METLLKEGITALVDIENKENGFASVIETSRRKSTQ